MIRDGRRRRSRSATFTDAKRVRTHAVKDHGRGPARMSRRLDQDNVPEKRTRLGGALGGAQGGTRDDGPTVCAFIKPLYYRASYRHAKCVSGRAPRQAAGGSLSRSGAGGRGGAAR